MQAIGATMQRIGASMLGVGAVIGAALMPAVSAASDLGESLSKNATVFGDMAGEVEEFGTKAAKSIGMSKQAAVEAASTFGNFLQAMGTTQGEAKDMSLAMVKLAADLASFNNANPEDVLLALRSGLSGEAEPMRKFGVALSETAVKAKAAEMGLEAVGGKLTEQQKIAARYAIIMEQTAMAQGDFARTSGGLANQQRILAAQWEDMKASIGQALLPAVTALMSKVNEILPPIMAWIGQNQKLVQVIAIATVVIGTIGGAILTAGLAFSVAALAFSGLATAVGLILSPVGLAVVGIVALSVAIGAAVVWALKATGVFDAMGVKFGATWKAIVGAVKGGELSLAFQIAAAQVKVVWAELIDALMKKWDEFKNYINDKFMDLPGAEILFPKGVKSSEKRSAKGQAGRDKELDRLQRELADLQKKAIAETDQIVMPKGSKLEFVNSQAASASLGEAIGKLTDAQRGTFSGDFASTRLGQGIVNTAQDRAADATEEVAKTVKDILGEVKGMAIEFS